MKKIWMTFALAGAMALAACGDDDPAAWEKLPTAPITGADATLSVNGGAATGTVQLTATSATQGTLVLTNVLPGYAQISMDVALAEQADGSFDISGKTGLSTPPSMITKAEAAEAALFELTVNGNLTAEGKAKVNVTSALSTAAQGGLSGTWNLLSKLSMADDGTLSSAPIWMEWGALDKEKPNAEQVALVVRTLVSPLLFQVLHSVTFSPDGNITAQYWSGELDIVQTMFGALGEDEQGNPILLNMHESEPWLTSPKNLAFWYVKGDRLWIVPNITAILEQVSSDTGSDVPADMSQLTALLGSLGEYGIKVDELLPLVMEWMTTGVPLQYEQTGSGLKLYVDKQMCAPFMEALLPALPKLDELIAKLVAENPDDEMVQMLPLVFMMLNIEKFADLVDIWKTNTDTFEISLNLIDQASQPSAAAVGPMQTNADRSAMLKRYMPTK